MGVSTVLRLKLRWGRCAVVAVAFVLSTGSLQAGTFLGADEVIEKGLAAEKASGNGAGSSADPLKKLSVEAEHLFRALPEMEPEKAAQSWLDLLLRFWSIQKPEDGMYGYDNNALSTQRILTNIPGPETWPILQRMAAETSSTDKTKLAALRTVLAQINQDNAATSVALAELKAAANSKYDRKNPLFDELEQKLKQSQDKPQSVVERYEKRLLNEVDDTRGYQSSFMVPDLVTLTDEATARRLLELTLAAPNLQLEFTGDNETARLARQLALDNIKQMEKPRWDLVKGLGTIDLYEAIDKKFSQTEKAAFDEETTSPEKSMAKLLGLMGGHGDEHSDDEDATEAQRKAAAGYYYLNLIAANRLEDAERVFSYDDDFVSSLKWTAFRLLQQLPSKVLYSELNKKLDAVTTAPVELWDLTQDIALRQNVLPDYVERLEAKVKSKTVDDESLIALYALLAESYKTLNQPDKAADSYKHILELPFSDDTASRQADAASNLIDMGDVLKRPEWVNIGIEQFRKISENIQATKRSAQTSYFVVSSNSEKLVSALMKERRYEETEQYLVKVLAEQVAESSGNGIALRANNALASLAVLYDKVGRPQDIMELLTDAPWWMAEDVSGINNDNFFGGVSDRGQLEVAVAHGLATAGYNDEAVALLKRTIIKNPSYDRAYDALTSMTGVALVPWLDELATRDPFEERPTIWKAVVLHRAGDLAGAEAAARKAMKIDPTDGEQPKGQRLLAYAVLADILEDAHQSSESQKLKKVVAAVRLAEHGDELNELGLSAQAVKVYEQASKDFSDAYCVEWRLARRLQERGDDVEATKHYTKAFELMPNQFGRLANLCFGCENIFEFENVQSIAESVLQKMAATPPVKPTVYHLLGQLREAQNNYIEAAQYYRKAIEVDPAYFDAWNNLYDIAEKAFLSQEEKSKIATHLMELDPFLQHFTPSSDLEIPPAVLWKAGERNRKWLQDIDKPIFTLTASKARIEDLKKKKNRAQAGSYLYRTSGMDSHWAGPGTYLFSSSWMDNLMPFFMM